MFRKITAGMMSFALMLTSVGAPQWAHAVRQVPGDTGNPDADTSTTWKDDGPKVDPKVAK